MIQVQGLGKRFRDVVALQDVSFEVTRGETFALLGPNGSGKTTTLKCLAGLTLPSSGVIRIEGVDLARNPVAAKSSFSYLPQHVTFPEQITAREVLDFYRRLRRLPADRMEAALDDCALRDAADRLVSEFSGGMTQRLGIAVALLSDAPMLLLDEPTASLDPESAAAFRGLLESLKQRGKSIVFSSHVLSDVDRLADRVAILVGGRLRAVETVGALRAEMNTQALLRVRVSNPHKRFCAVAVAAGAAGAQCSTDGLAIAAAPPARRRILHALEQAGAEIASFSTVEPSLEDIYLRYIHEDPRDAAAAADGGRLREPAAAAG